VAPKTAITITPGSGALAITGAAPAPILGTIQTPPVGALTLSGLAPTSVLGTVSTPPVGALTLTGIAPSTTQSGYSALPGTGTLGLEGIAPIVIVGDLAPPIITIITAVETDGAVTTARRVDRGRPQQVGITYRLVLHARLVARAQLLSVFQAIEVAPPVPVVTTPIPEVPPPLPSTVFVVGVQARTTAVAQMAASMQRSVVLHSTGGVVGRTQSRLISDAERQQTLREDARLLALVQFLEEYFE